MDIDVATKTWETCKHWLHAWEVLKACNIVLNIATVGGKIQIPNRLIKSASYIKEITKQN